ncbi:uncharacterized protein V1513DRAFT_447949, partial [Lipomyces chichibuensis]|uniref:uncharacterized protein n=1 Tax=Lipomyces chichibuensis TaxID=1546026 RepID=UPI00334335C2
MCIRSRARCTCLDCSTLRSRLLRPPFSSNGQHRILWFATRLLHALIVSTLRVVTLDNIEQYMLIPSTNVPAGRLVISQTVIHRAFSLVSAKGTRRPSNSKLDQVYNDTFAKYRDCLQPCLGDGEHLMGTSLQYAGKQLAANFSVMMAAQIWKRTAYWIRQEMVEIILERVEPIPIFQGHKSKIVDAIYSWLHKFIMHEGALDAQPRLAGKSEEEI